MAVSHTTALNLIGKYVEFSTDNVYSHIGVVNSVSIHLDGKIDITFDSVEFYDLSQVSKFSILGEVTILETPIPFEN